MNIKSLLKVIGLKQLLIVLLAPLSLGAVESFYKFDIINLPLFILTAAIVIFAGISINAFHVLNLYRHKWLKELEISKGMEKISIKTVNYTGITSLALSLIMLIILYKMTTLSVVIPFIITLLLFIIYVIGPKPLWQTALNEVIYSFGIGYLIVAFITYSQVYHEVTNIFSFYVLILWVSLPIVFSLACIQFTKNQKIEKYYDNLWTMTSLMGKNTTIIVMEIAMLLACLMPCIAIYLNDMPWTIILIWLMYPKLASNLRKYQHTRDFDEKLYYVAQNATIIIVFQVLLMIFGIFF